MFKLQLLSVVATPSCRHACPFFVDDGIVVGALLVLLGSLLLASHFIRLVAQFRLSLDSLPHPRENCAVDFATCN